MSLPFSIEHKCVCYQVCSSPHSLEHLRAAALVASLLTIQSSAFGTGRWMRRLVFFQTIKSTSGQIEHSIKLGKHRSSICRNVAWIILELVALFNHRMASAPTEYRLCATPNAFWCHQCCFT
eukprot:6186868-Pleurochrysis_carterae.AAC.1